MFDFLTHGNALPRPPRPDHPSISPWIDEQIWGHRLWDAQTPWLLFLELLTVAEACQRGNELLSEPPARYPLQYRPYRRLYLRNVLFNNEFAVRIDAACADSGRAWDEWLKQMADVAQGTPTRDFSYLRERFPSFHDFAALVVTIRRTAVESATNRRWSSRFVFPFGPNALYEDINVKSGRPSREYINFGRTGELLYLMLCRCDTAQELRSRLNALLSAKHPLDRLIRLMQPADDEDLHLKGFSYLPYSSHPVFNLLGEDWLSILDLKLPGFDAYQYLVLLSALHVLLYQLRTAADIAKRRPPIFVCEAVAPRKTLVRELSAVGYQENDMLSTEAVDVFISEIERSEEWQVAIRNATSDADACARCRDILENRCWWGSQYDGPASPTALISDLREVARQGHRQHAGNVHCAYGRAVGLISKRGTNRMRYAPNDALLKALVVANVHIRMEFGEFLSCLFERYGFVFGEREAERALDLQAFDQKAFQANAARLEGRLVSMGLLRRLSDACAYVVNPFTEA